MQKRKSNKFTVDLKAMQKVVLASCRSWFVAVHEPQLKTVFPIFLTRRRIPRPKLTRCSKRDSKGTPPLTRPPCWSSLGSLRCDDLLPLVARGGRFQATAGEVLSIILSLSLSPPACTLPGRPWGPAARHKRSRHWGICGRRGWRSWKEAAGSCRRGIQFEMPRRRSAARSPACNNSQARYFIKRWCAYKMLETSLNVTHNLCKYGSSSPLLYVPSLCSSLLQASMLCSWGKYIV